MKKNIKLKKFIPYIVAFLIPILLFSFCLFIRLKNSYGDLTIFLGDMTAQYVPLFAYLKNVFDGVESLSYSFSNGIGGGMIGTFAYYLTSPLNLILAFTSQASIPIVSIVLLLLKVGLGGLFMYIFLSNILKKKEMSLIIFSTCYALCAYFVNYYFCLMWLDCLYLIPLVMLGIHNLCSDKSPILYIISLTIAIISNYYIGYMLCIFCCIYFIYEILLKGVNKKEFLKYFKKFLITSILSGLMTFILLVPMFIDLMNTPRAFGDYNGKYTLEFVKNNFDYLLLFKEFLLGSRDVNSIGVNDAYYYNICVYCGLIILPLIYFYFVNKKVSKREKICSLFLILFFLCSYSVKYVSYIWHGFAFPNGFNYRFSFVFIFCFVFIATKSFYKLKNIDKKYYYYFAIVFIILLNMLTLVHDDIELSCIYINLIVMLFYLVLLYLYGLDKIDVKTKKDLHVLLPLLVFGELFFNCYMSLESYFNFTVKEYDDSINKYQYYIDKYNIVNDSQFYRMSQDYFMTFNPGLFHNYNGFTFFLSTINENVLNHFENLGYSTLFLTYLHNANTSYISDSLMGLKYYLSSTGCNHAEEVDSFEYSTTTGEFYNFFNKKVSVCENENNLSLGYLINTNIDNYSMNLSDGITYLNISEYIVNSMLNENKYYFNKYDNVVTISPGEYQFYSGENEYIYITISDAYDSASIKINDQTYNIDDKSSSILMIKNENKNTENNISVEVIVDDKIIKNPNINIYSEDTEGIVEALNKLKQNEMKIKKFSDTHIKGNVEVKDKDMAMLFLSIPYEDGWTLYVDGKETDIEILYDTFMGATLSEGEHEIELVYHVPGLKIGAIISGISLSLTITYLYFERKKRKESQIMLEN